MLNYPGQVAIELAIAFDLSAIIFSVWLAVTLRVAVPFGDAYSTDASTLQLIPPLIAGLVGSYLVNRFRQEGFAKFLHLMLFLILILTTLFIFSPGPVSRLLLIYLVFLGMAALIAARLLTNAAISNPPFLKFLGIIGMALEKGKKWLDRLVNKAKLDYLLVAGFGIAWGQFFISMGLTLTPDSTTYLSSALKLYYSGQLSQSSLWPPLYPILIAIFLPFSRFPADAAAIASLLTLAALLAVWVAALRRISNNALLNLLLIACLATLTSFIYIFESVWSEQLFALCIVTIFFFLLQFLESRKSHYFALAAVTASLSMVSRYVGISMGIAMLFVSVFWIDWLSLRERLWKFTAPALLMFAPLGLWMARNYLVTQSLFGPGRLHPEVSPLSSLSTIAGLLIRDLRTPFWVLAGLLVLILIVHRFTYNVKKPNIAINLVGLVSFAYLGFLVLSALVSPVDIDTRFMSPIYFLAFVFLAAVFPLLESRELTWVSSTAKFLLRAAVFILLGFMLLEQYNSFENVIIDRRRNATTQALPQNSEGFDLSPTKAELQSLLLSELQDQDQLVLFVFLDDKNHYASSLLFKGSVIREPDFMNYRFANLNGKDYEITFSSAGIEKSIAYFDTTAFAKGILFPEELLKQASSSGNFIFYILVNEKWFLEYKLDPLTIEIPVGVSLLSSTHIEPYWIFEAEISK